MRTLSGTLPLIVARRDMRVLEVLARNVNKPVGMLLLENAHVILAHVFLLSNTSEYEEALQFFNNVLVERSGNEKFDLGNIITSCRTELLAELITVMGDPDPEVAKMVCHSRLASFSY
jgi:serine/threonine-protein kinase ATR